MAYSKDLRKRVLYLSTTFGFSTREIGHLVHLGKSTVARWIQQQYPNKNPQPKKKIGRQSKIFAQIGELIAKSLKDSPLLTLKQLQSRINIQYQKKFSISTLSRWLKHNGLTYKQSRCRIQGKSTLSEQVKFLDEIRKYSHSQIISLDEVGFQLEMHRQRGWSVRGKRCIYLRNGTRRQNYHGIFSIGTDGQVLYKIYDAPIKLGIFHDYVKDVFGTNVAGKVLILDNLRVHHNVEIKKTLYSKFKSVIWTPSYSPEFNPIEMFFSSLKAYLRRQSIQTKSELISGIESYIGTLDGKSLSKLYQHSLMHV